LLNAAEHEDRNPDSWSRPELIRVRGEIHALRGDLSIAERLFQDAMGAAQRQQALAWELRSTISLARLYSRQKRRSDAIALLEPLIDQFSEAFFDAGSRRSNGIAQPDSAPNIPCLITPHGT
jgi:predicted ATPase